MNKDLLIDCKILLKFCNLESNCKNCLMLNECFQICNYKTPAMIIIELGNEQYNKEFLVV